MLGIGELSAEFTDIFRRAFASRVLPHVVNQYVSSLLLYFCTIGNTWYFLLTTKYCRLQLKDYCRLGIKHVKVKYLSCYIGFLVLERPCWMERIPRYGYSYWASSIALLLILIYWFESVYVWSCEIQLTEIMQMYITVNVKNEKWKMKSCRWYITVNQGVVIFNHTQDVVWMICKKWKMKDLSVT